MPNRILRDSALDSDRIASVSEQAEVLFYRLLMLVDDFGRFDARPSVIRARAFALRQEVTVEEVIHRMQELCKAELIHSYESDGKSYFYIPRFGQRQRAEKSKFPAPVSEVRTDDCHRSANSQQSAARARAVVDVDVDDIRSRSRETPPVDKSKGNGSWWATRDTIIAKGQELGIRPNRGEELQAYKNRLFQHLKDPTTPKAIQQHCAYCQQPATITVGNIHACSTHADDAMDQKPIPVAKFSDSA